jgi:stress response protein SCP2
MTSSTSLFDGNLAHDASFCLVTSRFIKRVEGAVLSGPHDSSWDAILSKHGPDLQVYFRAKCPSSAQSLEVNSRSVVSAVEKIRAGHRSLESIMGDCSEATIGAFLTEMNKTVNKVDPKPGVPTFTPDGGEFSGELSVEMSSPSKGVSIRFTLDESDPSPHSMAYSGPLVLRCPITTVHAYAVNDTTLTSSPVVSAVFLRDCHPQAIVLQCFARRCAAKERVIKLADKAPCEPPMFEPSEGVFFDGLHFHLTQSRGNRMKYAIERPGHALEFFSYVRPVAVTAAGKFQIVAYAVRSNGVESLRARATFTVHHDVPSPLIFPNSDDAVCKDHAEVSVEAAQGSPEDVVMEYGVCKLASLTRCQQRLAATTSANRHEAAASSFVRYENTFCLREQGDHRVTAVALRKGPITGRWHTSSETHSTIKVRRSIYRVPKSLVHGVLTIASSTVEYLKQKEARLVGAITQALQFDTDSGSRCQLTDFKTAETGSDIDVHFVLELDRDDDVNPSGQAMVKALTDRKFNEKLTTQLREVGLTARANRAKGLAVKMKKADVEFLRKLTLDLAWNYGHTGSTDYLDGSCLLFESENVTDIVDFRNKSGGDGAVKHSGDVMDHAKKSGRHIINIDLDLLSSSTTDLALCLSAYKCKNLSKFQDPSIELFSTTTRHSLTTFILKNEDFTSSAAVMSMISKSSGGWQMTSCGFPCDGTAHSRTTYQPMVEAVAPLQERHPKWRRRGPLLVALQLLEKQRCFPIAGHEKDAQVLMLLGERLPSEIWQEVFRYI